MNNLFTELKRRNVLRVAAAYAVISWIILQVVDTVAPILELPESFAKGMLLVLIIGFPVALAMSWAYEATPEGIKKTGDVDADASLTHNTGQKLNRLIMAGLVVALGYFAFDKYMTVSDVTIETVEVAEGVKSIAVLPFINMSNDPEQEFFSDGISEELLNVLAKVDGLRVTSRTSAFQYKDTSLSIPEVAAELGVQYILEGSVRRGDGQVRITTQLIEVATDSHLWSETYDRDISNIFAVQDEIASRVAEALRVELLGEDHQPIAPIQKTSIDVYSDYLLARQKLATFAFDPMKEAVQLLNQAIAVDPAFAPAYEMLASVYLVMTHTGILSDSELVVLARPIIDSALALNDRLAGVWLADAYILVLEGKLDEAEAARQRAYAMEPKHPNVLRDQLMQSYWMRRPTDMSPVIDALFEVDPLSVLTFLSVNFWYSRQSQFENIRVMGRRLSKVQPNSPLELFKPVMTPLPEDNNVRKIESVRFFRTIEPTDPDGPAFLALVLMDAGETVEAGREIRNARALDEDHAFVAISDALYKIYRGDMKQALGIAQALAQPDASTRFGSRDMALRMLANRVLASKGVEEASGLISLYLSIYPGLVNADLTSITISPAFYLKWGHLMVALDLAALYEITGESQKSEVLLAAVEAELPFWPRRGVFGIGFSDAELYAIRGDNAAALAALRQALEEGLTQNWWFFLDHSPHFAELRGMPEFAKIRFEFAAIAAIPAEEASP